MVLSPLTVILALIIGVGLGTYVLTSAHQSDDDDYETGLTVEEELAQGNLCAQNPWTSSFTCAIAMCAHLCADLISGDLIAQKDLSQKSDRLFKICKLVCYTLFPISYPVGFAYIKRRINIGQRRAREWALTNTSNKKHPS